MHCVTSEWTLYLNGQTYPIYRPNRFRDAGLPKIEYRIPTEWFCTLNAQTCSVNGKHLPWSKYPVYTWPWGPHFFSLHSSVSKKQSSKESEKSEMHQVLSKWIETLNCQKYTLYTKDKDVYSLGEYTSLAYTPDKSIHVRQNLNFQK